MSSRYRLIDYYFTEIFRARHVLVLIITNGGVEGCEDELTIRLITERVGNGKSCVD